MLHAYGLLKTCCFHITPIIWGWGTDMSINITDLIFFFNFQMILFRCYIFLIHNQFRPSEAGEFYLGLRGK